MTRDDRELIRQYADLPATEVALFSITEAMNDTARVSPAAVLRIQGWINASEDLEEFWAAKVEEGTAHLGNQDSYEGPAPGRTLTRADIKSKLDVIEWDTSLLRVKYSGGNRAGSTEGEVIAQRISDIRSRILTALGIGSCFSSDRLVRS